MDASGQAGPAWRHWMEAARPKTLPAAVVPVVVATALAHSHGAAHGPAALVCLAFGVLVQVGTNFANDYYDFVQGADTPARVGPRRAVAAGLIRPAAMRRAMWIVLAAAFAVGLLLVAVRGWILLPVGIISIACAVAYTGGPYPLGYHGLGDVFVFLFFGLVAVGATFYVQAGHLAPDALTCGAALGLLAANILVANNYRDAETDARAGKRTLVVRFGRRFALWQYGLSHGVALCAPVALRLNGQGWPVLLPLLLAPWAALLTRRLERSQAPPEQIAVLGSTAKYLAAFGALLAAGLVAA
ncbi:MAG TPA: 1,4-dihydroxy-2-naphthoate polyprenyltransferase [Opitutaceae bacterium]|nr:1,4-dihydroxy-2-naphthoate polyprenyltransferase [Opitutaceae bacterium]